MHEIETKTNKAPFMTAKKKQSATDEEIETFYSTLREYYLNLPYDRTKVALEELNYRDIARISAFIATLKRTKVLNKERIISQKSAIYTSNHIGSYDQFYIPKLLKKIPLHYLVKDKVTKWPVRWNLVYKPTGVVVVDTTNLSSWLKAKTVLTQYLLHGGSVFMFAEGSRRGEDNMGDFNPGIAQIAQDTGRSVCTLAIKNTVSIFSRKPIICAGEVFTVDPREDIRIATERIKNGVISAYNEILKFESEREKGSDAPILY